MRAAHTTALSLPLVQNTTLLKMALFLSDFLRETLNRHVLRLRASLRPQGAASMEIYLLLQPPHLGHRAGGRLLLSTGHGIKCCPSIVRGNKKATMVCRTNHGMQSIKVLTSLHVFIKTTMAGV